jgi:osmotically-inducible protein OsmY
MSMFKGQGKLIAGLLLGAGAMWLLDPERGARRRALVRDQGRRASRRLGEELEGAARDLRNRSSGAAAEVAARFRRDSADDDVVRERVRAALGRVVAHPHAVEVAVQDGRVVLSGTVEAGEAGRLAVVVRKVRGVTEVEDRLAMSHATGRGLAP